jgi:hypothetical protein
MTQERPGAEAWAADNDGADIWADPSIRFLDPCTKSGVFLREITTKVSSGQVVEPADHQTVRACWRLIALDERVSLDGLFDESVIPGDGQTLWSPVDVVYNDQSEALNWLHPGARVGAVGCTGSCSGDHLHFEIREGRGPYGEPRDPLPALKRWQRV